MISQLFDIANIFVLPFWAIMILLPNWGITRKVMESYLPFVALAGLYIYLFVVAITPETAQALSSPQLSDLAKAFSNETVTATGWVHFLVMDLFIGRWIYWEGQKTGVFTTHSLALCLFAGPMGLLSHILTSWITQKFFAGEKQDSVTPSTSAP
ncbi:ABA4-like family protein [Microseira wollei]|uniref:DUF4281 domain-containing protein n=1 Tax=Microseira wollei NIES-4236 TaxID=2530354 RepID=A0AAV3XIS2_9CYAN|nr:ABA4-like family protein [Microseira wollei]GET40312.1 hypothetical protein MiSe_51210 [Microseira wollei NIES-4236]